MIYGGYKFFTKEEETNPTKVVKEIKQSKKVELKVVKDKQTLPFVEKKIETVKPIKTTKTAKKPKTPLSKEKIAVINKFLHTTKEKINNNISKLNLQKDTNKKQSVKIRVTILKSGDYEQLTFTNGDVDFFTKIKPAVQDIFPIKIDSMIDDQFPRYFRMRVEL